MLDEPAIRRTRRPDPRLATALAGAGCDLAVTGALVIGGDALDGGGDGGGSQFPGIILSALVLAGGLLLLTRTPRGPLHTAGSVAATLSIPPLMFFVTFDRDGFPPYSTEGILLVSAAVWIALHLVGPAAGRTFPLGAGLIAAWLFVLQIIEEPFTSPFDLFSSFDVTDSVGIEESGAFGNGGGFQAPDVTTMGIITLLFGLGMLVAGQRLDRAGERGRATAFAFAAVPMLPIAVALLADELQSFGSGLVLAALGGAMAFSGAVRGRRLTNWAGGLFLFFGVAFMIDEIVGDSVTAFGIASLIAGGAVVFGADRLADATGEQDELVEGPSVLGGSAPSTASPEF